MRNNTGLTRIVVVDDHPAIREALAGAVKSISDVELIGEADTASGLLDLIKTVRPDVAVVDISLQDAHGLDLVRTMRVQYPEVRIVVFSMYEESAYAERAIRVGALGYVMKTASVDEVMQAIHAAVQDEVYLSRRMASRMLAKIVRDQDRGSTASTLDMLTDREMAVFHMLGEGLSVDDIADRLNLGRKTVETYRRRAKEKLGLGSVFELMQYAIHWTSGHSGDQSAVR